MLKCNTHYKFNNTENIIENAAYLVICEGNPINYIPIEVMI